MSAVETATTRVRIPGEERLSTAGNLRGSVRVRPSGRASINWYDLSIKHPGRPGLSGYGWIGSQEVASWEIAADIVRSRTGRSPTRRAERAPATATPTPRRIEIPRPTNPSPTPDSPRRSRYEGQQGGTFIDGETDSYIELLMIPDDEGRWRVRGFKPGHSSQKNRLASLRACGELTERVYFEMHPSVQEATEHENAMRDKLALALDAPVCGETVVLWPPLARPSNKFFEALFNAVFAGT